MTTAGEALVEAAALLAKHGIERPRFEARLLLSEATGQSAAQLLADAKQALANGKLGQFQKLVARRAEREPMAYILGRAEFWSMEIAVEPGVLVPRADSETLIEAAMAVFRERSRPLRILDIGVGSGCLVLALLQHFNLARGVGTDVSATALACARRNAASCGLQGRLALVRTVWARGIAAPFDLVVSNPPYIASAEIAGLPPEVARYEPRLALDGGVDGLDAYRAILSDLPRLLDPTGFAILEIGADQAPAVASLASHRSFTAAVEADLAGRPRCLILRHT